MRVAWLVGIRLLLKRSSTLLTASSQAALVAIGLGVASLVVSLSLMNGYREALRAGILNASGHVLIISASAEDTAHALGLLEKKPEVAWFGSVHFLSGLVGKDAQSGGDMITLKATEKLPPFIAIPQGSDHNGLPVAVGRGLAEKLGLREGQRVFLQLAHPGGRPVYLPAKVAQVFSASFAEIDQSWLFCSAKALARHVPDLPGSVQEVYLNDPDKASQLANELVAVVKPGVIVRSWQEMNRELFAALRWQKITLALVLSLILGVGAFEVASSLVVLITEKRRELGILMAMGAREVLVRQIVMAAGCVLGASGVVAGLIFGMALVALANLFGFPSFSPELAAVYMVARIPWKIEGLDLAVVFLGGVVETLVTSFVTAHPFTRKEPAEVLRWA